MRRQIAFPYVLIAIVMLLSSTVRADLILEPVDIAEWDGSTVLRSFPMMVQLGPPTKRVAAEFSLQDLVSVDSAVLDLSGSATVLSEFLLRIGFFVGNGTVEAPDDFNITADQIFAEFVNDQTLLQFDVTDVVTNSLNAGNGYLGFTFADDTDNTLRFASAPTLAVVGKTVPEPAILGLMSVGLAGIGYQRRKRLTP